MKKKLFYLLLGVLLLGACQEENFEQEQMQESPPILRAIPTLYFDWEIVDWMPTPPGQSRISPPWIGAGSVASLYGLDVMNDRKKSDGWELLYSTFDAAAPGPLVDPHFILYNKYRGIMRIFFYITTPFVTTSSYIQDGISVLSNTPTSILSYLGKELINPNSKPMSYTQIQPTINGSAPLAANKWYMMEYELAYDPNIANMPYEDIGLNWFLNYYNVTSISLGGTAVGDIKAVVGSSSSPSFFTPLKNGAKVAGTGVLAGIGQKILTDNTIDATTGENSLGLPNNTFKSILTGVGSAVASAAGGIPGQVINILNAIIGGSSTSTPPLNYKFDVNIELEGNGTNYGLFPSSPVLLYMPGTNIHPLAQGYMPYYDTPLGVFGVTNLPTIAVPRKSSMYRGEDPWNGFQYVNEVITEYYPQVPQMEQSYVINPEVLKIADVTVNCDLLVYITDGWGVKHPVLINPTGSYSWELGYVEHSTTGTLPPKDVTYGVRFRIEVTPKNSQTPKSTIIKSFILNHRYYYYSV